MTLLMVSPRRTKQLHVWLEPDELDELGRVTRALGISRATFVRYVVGNAIAQHASALRYAPQTAASIGDAIAARVRARDGGVISECVRRGRAAAPSRRRSP